MQAPSRTPSPTRRWLRRATEALSPRSVSRPRQQATHVDRFEQAEAHRRLPTQPEWAAATPRTGLRRGAHTPELRTIDLMLTAYPTSSSWAQRLIRLHDLEAVLYAAVDRSDRADAPSRRMPALRGLLDALQGEHQRVVGHLLEHDPDALAEIVADGDANAAAGWRRLVAGNGPLVIRGAVLVPATGTPSRPSSPLRDDAGDIVMVEEAHSGFRVAQLSNVVRLMRSSAGRRLVNKLHDTRPRSGRTQFGDLSTDIAPQPMRRRQLGAAATCERKDAGRFGMQQQSGSLISLPDWRDSDAGAYYSAGGRMLLATAWITLAHELLHAKHNMQGKSRRDVRLTAAEIRVWSSEEERHTIAGGKHLSENILRAGAGLTVPRHGHRPPWMHEDTGPLFG